MYQLTKEQRDFLITALAEVPAKISFQALVMLNQLKEIPKDEPKE